MVVSRAVDEPPYSQENDIIYDADELPPMNPQHRDELATLVTELVRIDSENPPGEEGGCAHYIHDWFTDHDVDTDLITEPYADRPQVVARVGQGKPTVVYNGHLDVVPAGDTAHWTYPPYAGEQVNERIYGRGSADMKAGLAIAMLATRTLVSELGSGDGTVVFHGAIGEETGEPGTRILLEKGYDGDYGVILEPTDFRVATKAKGLVCYEIAVEGEPSHASRPDQGENAVLLSQPVVEAIEAYDHRVREHADELVGRAYANITRFESGVGGNLGVLPGTASFVLDRRVLPGESIIDVETEISDLLDTVKEQHSVETTYEEIQRYEPAAVPTDCGIAEIFREQTRQFRDSVDAPWGIEAATDMRHFVNDAGMEAITWGPGRLSQAHTNDEYIELTAAHDGLSILLNATRTLLGSEVRTTGMKEYELCSKQQSTDEEPSDNSN
jgi:succinyl-diaminopimelate desuccinylase